MKRYTKYCKRDTINICRKQKVNDIGRNSGGKNRVLQTIMLGGLGKQGSVHGLFMTS